MSWFMRGGGSRCWGCSPHADGTTAHSPPDSGIIVVTPSVLLGFQEHYPLSSQIMTGEVEIDKRCVQGVEAMGMNPVESCNVPV